MYEICKEVRATPQIASHTYTSTNDVESDTEIRTSAAFSCCSSNFVCQDSNEWNQIPSLTTGYMHRRASMAFARATEEGSCGQAVEKILQAAFGGQVRKSGSVHATHAKTRTPKKHQILVVLGLGGRGGVRMGNPLPPSWGTPCPRPPNLMKNLAYSKKLASQRRQARTTIRCAEL